MSLATTTLAQSVPNYVPTNGLVGWWPFNGNANDESGNGNNGTIIGNIDLSQDRFGISNKSYNFIGNGHVQLPSINLSSFTINAWVKRLPGVNGVIVVSKHYSSSFTNSSYLIYSQSSQNNFCTPSIYFTNTSNVPNGIDANGTSWCDNNWHMITSVLTSNFLRIYFDGNLINSSTGGVAKSTNFNTLIGGGYSNSGVITNQNFGMIDDVGFWNRDLTQQEITDLYNANICYDHVTVTDTLIINTNMIGFNPVTYQNTIKVWPNPAHDHITIDNGNIANLNGYQIKISNVLGQQVFQSAINQQQFYINLSTWTGNGTYYINLINPQGVTVETRVIVVQ